MLNYLDSFYLHWTEKKNVLLYTNISISMATLGRVPYEKNTLHGGCAGAFCSRSVGYTITQSIHLCDRHENDVIFHLARTHTCVCLTHPSALAVPETLLVANQAQALSCFQGNRCRCLQLPWIRGRVARTEMERHRELVTDGHKPWCSYFRACSTTYGAGVSSRPVCKSVCISV